MSTNAQLVERLAPTLVGLPYETWNFGDSVAFEALLAASDFTGEQRWASFAHGWARAWATRATPYRRLDCTAPGLAIVHLAVRFEDAALLRAAIDLADYLLKRPRLHGIYETWEHSPLMRPYGGATLAADEEELLAAPPPGVFVDCLHFDPPFFAALARATGEPRYAREAVEQAIGYITLLQRPDGLFDHFALRGRDGTYGPGWGRGQGWALLGLLDVLTEFGGMPDEMAAAHTAELQRIADSVSRLVRAQAGYQRPDGHWFAVVDDPASGDEYSTAAFMTAGFLRALRGGWVDGDDIARSAHAAAAAVRAGIDASGTLGQVSAAVMACTAPSHYAHVPRGFRVPWGQGPALIALATLDAREGSGSIQSIP